MTPHSYYLITPTPMQSHREERTSPSFYLETYRSEFLHMMEQAFGLSSLNKLVSRSSCLSGWLDTVTTSTFLTYPGGAFLS